MMKKGEMGIGTLIVFIAMILVAAIAAGVLIRTATSLQSRALLTGERSKEQVSTSAVPLMLMATNGSTSNDLEDFIMKVKLAPGSDPIKFSDALIEFDLNDGAADLSYGAGTCDYDAGETADGSGGFWTDGTGAGFYTIEYLESGPSQTAGYLQNGDLVKICFQSLRSVEEDESFTLSFIPKVGNVMEIESSIPSVVTTEKVIIYP